jgi:DNA-binding protein YbaB
MAEIAGRPDWGALRSMLGDLQKATAELPNTRKKMLQVTGTAWSPDRMIKAVVGPRGHLLELEIDPRLLRQPNAKALSAAIVQTVRAAVEEAGQRSSDLLQESLPVDMRASAGGELSAYIGKHDSETMLRPEGDDE